VINANVTVMSPPPPPGVPAAGFVVIAGGTITVNGTISTPGNIVLSGSTVSVNEAPNLIGPLANLILDERGDAPPSLPGNIVQGPPKLDGKGKLGRFARGLGRGFRGRGADPGTAHQASRTARGKWVQSDVELREAALRSNDPQLDALVRDVLGLLESSGGAAPAEFDALPFGGEAATVVPGVLSYEPSVGQVDAGRARLSEAVESSPVLFGGVTF